MYYYMLLRPSELQDPTLKLSTQSAGEPPERGKITAAQRGSRAATGMVVLWWQSRHETSSSPGSAIRSDRGGGPVNVQVPTVCTTMVR
jgi:hypothetical protein